MTITKEYQNVNNGGKERITRDGDRFYIDSYIPHVGWLGEREVSKIRAEFGMRWTKAPTDVVSAIIFEVMK